MPLIDIDWLGGSGILILFYKGKWKGYECEQEVAIKV